MIYLKNYINGALISPKSERYIDNYNPSTGEVYAQIPDSDLNDVNTAVEAASNAFDKWSNTSKDERSKILYKIE